VTRGGRAAPAEGKSFDAARFADTFDVSRETMVALGRYAALLIRWQRRINLVAESTIADLWWRHFADSAQLAALMPGDARVIADVGSGAGFPGLVIALMRPMFHVKLIESNAKKAAFLRAVVARAGARNVAIRRERVECITGWTADVIVARACAPLPRLLALTDSIRRPDTVCRFLKGADAQVELTAAEEGWKMAAETTPSLTSPDSVIVKLSEVSRAP
jgi:16S rRNA (guanine527-N7)-methyltransferase